MGLDTKSTIQRGGVTLLELLEGIAEVWGTPSVAAPGPVKGHFLPRAVPQSPLPFAPLQVRRSRQRGTSGPGRISSADLRLLEPPGPGDPAGPRTARAQGPPLTQRFRSDPSFARPFHPAPPLLSRGSSVRKMLTRSRVPDKPSHAGPRLPGARTPQLGRGGAWWGGTAGEVFKLEAEPPPRGSAPVGRWSSGAPPRAATPGSGAGWDRGRGRSVQNVPGLPGRGAAATLSR